MKITLLTYGSEGDVAPFSALGKGLVQAGHQVRLAAPQKFNFLVNRDQIDFVSFPGDPGQIVQDLVEEAGNNLWRMIRSMIRFVLPLGVEVSQIAREACRDADLIIHSFLLTNTGYEIARENNIPDISAQTFPVFTSTSEFPAPVAPDLPLGGFYRRLTHAFMTQIFWQGSRVMYRQIRKKNPHFPPLSNWPFDKRNEWQTPILYAFSPSVIPRPNDWRNGVHITGYWLDENPDNWIPDKKLLAFIKSGPPPIAVVFGSTVTNKLKGMYQKILEALEITHQRGIIVGNKTGLEDPSQFFFQTDYIPYDWLFNRSAAVIHHGGAGTTGKALKAGIPNIVLPFTSDQPFWARRVYKLGAGPKIRPPNQVSAVQLSLAINSAINNREIRAKAQEIGKRLDNENGVSEAVKLIEEYARSFKA